MTIYTVADLLNGLFTAIIISILLDCFCSKRDEIPEWVYVVGVIVLAGLMDLSNFVFGSGIFNAVGLAVSIFIVSNLYSCSIQTKVVISVLGVLLIVAVELVILFPITIIYGVTVSEVVDSPFLRLLGIIVSKMATFIVVKIICLKTKKRNIYLGSTYWVLFCLIFSTSIVAVFLIFKLSYDIKVKYLYNLSVLCSFGLLFSTFFALYLYEHLAEQTELINKQRQFEQQVQSQAKHMDEILAVQNQLKKFRHDFSLHLTALSGYFRDKDYDGGLGYIESISSIIDESRKFVDTGNTALDTIINTKKVLAESKNIDFKVTLQIPENLAIDATDVCIIFGNALDNAIEACERTENIDKKIKLAIIYEDNRIFCKIVNTAFKSKDKKSLYETSKKDKNNHGFGLENIRTSLAKYNAIPEITQTETEFTIKFLIFIH